MAGKIIVGLMGLLAVATAVFGIWFLVLPSPIDQRFNLSRDALTEISNPSLLLPSAIGDFQQKSLTPFDGGTHASAGYADDMDNLIMNMSATLNQPTKPMTQQDISQSLTAQLTKVTAIHADAPFPFAYGTGLGGYTFTWINGPWQFVASTSQSDPESLLQFVNTYVY